MTLKEKQLEFIIYCIENTAERLGRYSADVYNKLKELIQETFNITKLNVSFLLYSSQHSE